MQRFDRKTSLQATTANSSALNGCFSGLVWCGKGCLGIMAHRAVCSRIRFTRKTTDYLIVTGGGELTQRRRSVSAPLRGGSEKPSEITAQSKLTTPQAADNPPVVAASGYKQDNDPVQNFAQGGQIPELQRETASKNQIWVALKVIMSIKLKTASHNQNLGQVKPGRVVGDRLSHACEFPTAVGNCTAVQNSRGGMPTRTPIIDGLIKLWSCPCCHGSDCWLRPAGPGTGPAALVCSRCHPAPLGYAENPDGNTRNLHNYRR